MTRHILASLATAALVLGLCAGEASAGAAAPTMAPAPAAAPGATRATAPAVPHAAAMQALAPGAATAAQGKPYWHMLGQYCETCHNVTDWAGSVAFATLHPQNIPKDAQVWETAIMKLSGHLMPPPGHKQPSQAQIDAFIAWMSNHLDAAAAARPDPGFVVMHRLNRAQYARSVDEMLGLSVDPSALLPPDTLTDGFDDIAAVLKVSPTFLDQYINAAQTVAGLAMGNAHAAKAISVYVAAKHDQAYHIEGLPLGTRGGMTVTRAFPADGLYKFDLSVYTGIGYLIGLDHPNEVVLSIDGQKVFGKSIGGAQDLKEADQHPNQAKIDFTSRFQNVWVRVPAGPHRIGVSFVANTLSESSDWLKPLNPMGRDDRLPVVEGLKITWPFAPTGVSETPSRAKILICHPASASEETPCARKVLTKLAMEAFRRPLTDADLTEPMSFYAQGRAHGTFDTGIENGIVAILCSPKFLFRTELEPQSVKVGGIYHLSDLALASRLSFFLWGTGPDPELIGLAASNRLHDPQVLAREVRRMLADPRAQSLVTNWAFQWLEVDDMDKLVPDNVEFPGFDEDLRSAYRTEMRLFLGSVLLKDRDVLDLMTANWTFVNARLALEYHIPNVQGAQFRRVILRNPARWGLLGKGAMLMGTSYGNRTSPVLRGAWILEVVTDTPPNAPPPSIPAFIENVPGKKPLTIRQRMMIHRRQPSCNACHGIMDPMGFAMQNFNAMGGWQTKGEDTGLPIDATGKMADGTQLDGVGSLRQALMRKPQLFVETVAKKLMTYALGRTLDYHDIPTVRAIVRNAAHDDDRFSALVLGIVESPQFQTEEIPSSGPDGPFSLQTTQAANLK
ncbi:MAG: DUF1592 domain-containing protein [Steroidobacteraceae bacterium]